MINPMLLADFYKVGHEAQYPKDVTQIWSNWTPRSSRVPGQSTVVHFGLQYFIKDYLMRRFQHGFFARPLGLVLQEYGRVVATCLGVDNPRIDHIAWLHSLGYLPVDIYSIPEGYSTPLGVPSLVITNTLPEAFWLPNYFETMLSMCLWKPSTSATTAQRFRKIGMKWAKAAGETDFGFVDWQFHDFSMRGMSGLEDAILSGMGHLTSFSGTDTIPAIVAAREFYGASLACGGSVPATEHSVMCAGGKDGEFETFRHLIEDVYPSGVLSIVSDTWDLWKVLTDYIPRLKDVILARKGKIVIRPDSGDPVKIILGDDEDGLRDILRADELKPLNIGVIDLLAKALGTTGGMINNAAAIYGDSINEERAEAILKGLVQRGYSPYNEVFGIGSFTYEWRTRDTYGFAMKATAVRRSGTVCDIFKDPVTDTADTPKKSHKGIPAVYRTEMSTEDNPEYFVKEGAKPEDLDNCAFEKVYSNGRLLIDTNFDTIRRRVRAWERV
jgi:nicotinamide phosphoribosyltransferase